MEEAPQNSRDASHISADYKHRSALETALRAQVFELRGKMARAQAVISGKEASLKRQQDILQSAAGEARREVLSLRAHKLESEGLIKVLNQRIAELESEISQLKDSRDTNIKDSPTEATNLDHEYGVSTVNLTAQIGELVLENAELKRKLALRKEVCGAWKGETNVDHQAVQSKATEAHQEALTKVEMYENELQVLRAETSHDTIASAAKQIELEQQCKQLKAELDFCKAKASRDCAKQEDVRRGASHSKLLWLDLALIEQGRATGGIVSHPLSQCSNLTPIPPPTLQGLEALLLPAPRAQGIYSPSRPASTRQPLTFQEAADEQPDSGKEAPRAKVPRLTLSSEEQQRVDPGDKGLSQGSLSEGLESLLHPVQQIQGLHSARRPAGRRLPIIGQEAETENAEMDAQHWPEVKAKRSETLVSVVAQGNASDPEATSRPLGSRKLVRRRWFRGLLLAPVVAAAALLLRSSRASDSAALPSQKRSVCH